MRLSALAIVGLAAIPAFGLACSTSSSSVSGSPASSGASRTDAMTSGVSEAPGSDGGSTASGSMVDDAGEAGDEADASPCASYPGAVDSYAADLAKAGTSGQLQFVLVSAQPGPPAKGDNTWTLKVMDTTGASIQNATFDIKTWMPMMHHGSSIAPRQATNADATYSISNLYFSMVGIWQVTFTTESGTTRDTATYTFCIDR